MTQFTSQEERGAAISAPNRPIAEKTWMSTLRTTSLAEPTGTGKISRGTLTYVRGRNQHRAYDLVIRELKKSGITQADLARRLDKGQDAISRLLSRPRNWELDTLSDLLFA